MRVIAFKIWGDFALFRRFYTTSSPLTYPFPPPSTIRGLIAAILGLKREKYPEILSPQKSRVGVRLLSPSKKITLGINYLDTKSKAWVNLRRSKGGRFHTQVRLELLKDPSYEIYFHHSDVMLMDELRSRLKNHSPYYTPYLGISECLADFEFLWDIELTLCSGFGNVVSAFLCEDLLDLKLEEETALMKVRMPMAVSSDRTLIESADIMFNPFGKSICVKLKSSYSYPYNEEARIALLP